MAKDPVRVLVTGAAGQIGYALVPMIARGIMLGADQPVILHMLDIPPAAEALNDMIHPLESTVWTSMLFLSVLVIVWHVAEGARLVLESNIE